MRDAFAVERTDGDRWDRAVDLLRDGDGFVTIGRLLLYRDAHGPRATGTLRVEICSRSKPTDLTMVAAVADIADGLRTLDSVLADSRVAQLVQQHGIAREYVYDQDTGRVGIAALTSDGTPSWIREPPRP